MPDKGQQRRKKSERKPAPATKPPADGTSSATGCAGWLWWKSDKDAEARSRAKEDYDKIPTVVRAEFDTMRRLYTQGGLRNGSNIKALGGGLYEFKYSHTGNTPFRFIFMRWGKWAVALDVFSKTTDKTPTDRAAGRRKRWHDLYGEKGPA